MNEPLHIICLDAPSPPDYGGAIDMFCKIRSLASIGRKIILHYFEYKKNRGISGLEEFCSEIHAYERTGFFGGISFHRPYIVRSRTNKNLISRLNDDMHPVLMEGLHCSGVLPFLNPSRRMVIRMHNEESVYYNKLAASEKSLVKRSYMYNESRLLHRYYSTIPSDTQMAVLSVTEYPGKAFTYGITMGELRYCCSFYPGPPSLHTRPGPDFLHFSKIFMGIINSLFPFQFGYNQAWQDCIQVNSTDTIHAAEHEVYKQPHIVFGIK